MLFTTLPVTSHTQYVREGGTFVAVRGHQQEGITYIPEALRRGARTIVADRPLGGALLQRIVAAGAVFIAVSDARHALATMSARAHGYPARQLSLIGVTGTAGKTTTSFILEHLLSGIGCRVALLSSVKNRILDVDYPTELTTAQPDYIHQFLRTCVDRGVTHVVVEVAAQAVTLHRVVTLEFDALIVTNFSQEHAEFYATEEDYFAAKVALLSQIKPSCPVFLNAHDARVASLSSRVQNPQLFPTNLINRERGLVGIEFEDQETVYRCSALLGDYNISNSLAALRCVQNIAQSLPEKRFDADTLRDLFSTFAGVPGRFNLHHLPGDVCVVIDRAYIPSSIELVLRMARNLTDHVIVVLGAGGDRDAARRPLMGKVAGALADCVIITTDNPRSEDPAVIAQEIIAGIADVDQPKVQKELDREAAIKLAYSQSRAGSLILLLGKGPDEYQIVNGVKIRFSEQEIVKKLA